MGKDCRALEHSAAMDPGSGLDTRESGTGPGKPGTESITCNCFLQELDEVNY